MVLVALGGMIGSLGRYWMSGVVQDLAVRPFPYGTLAVNVTGSFALGLIMALSLERGVIGADVRLFLSIGLCGGFTTMSTFSYETFALLREGAVVAAAANAVGTILLCLTAVWLGMVVARAMWG